MADSEGLTSQQDTELFVAYVGGLVEDLMKSDMTELQAIQTLDLLFSPSRVFLKYKQWSPQQRDDMLAALSRTHPPGGLVSIIHRAYEAAEQRVGRIEALNHPTSEVGRRPALALTQIEAQGVRAGLMTHRAFWWGAFASAFVLFMLYLLIEYFRRK